MRYKYSCTKCGLDEVKNFHYSMGNRVCGECGETLERKFIQPPKGWFNQISRSAE